VLAHIDRKIDAPLHLAGLAKLANFSPFHFHRLFTALLGETLGDYLRRRKLEIAGTRLVSQPETTILDIALAVGFASAESFSRAFKIRFGSSPTDWRRQQLSVHVENSKRSQVYSKFSQAAYESARQDPALRNSQQETIMKVTLIERPPTHIAYLRHTGPYGEPVSQFWQRQVYPWMVSNNYLGKPRYGISHDDPGITSATKCRYDAGVEIAADSAVSGRSFKATLPGGRYAATEFKGTVNDIQAAWSAVLREWLPSSGLQLDARPYFEYYAPESSFDPKSGVFDCLICIPVVPL
jgi:AraC family transcriptional regulator